MAMSTADIGCQLLPGLREVFGRYNFSYHDPRSAWINAPDVIDGEWTRVDPADPLTGSVLLTASGNGS